MPRKKKDNPGLIHFERRLIQIGDSVGITLPKKWLESHGHKLGDVFSGMANSILTVGRKVEIEIEEDKPRGE